ncbi:MAG: hypothetical protein ABIR79_05670 [Candidatus Binatia bacterium]
MTSSLEMRRQAEAIIRSYGEIDRHVAEVGIDGIDGLMELSKVMEAAVGVVSFLELERVVGEIRSLLERLVRMDSELEQLRVLKLVMASDDEGALVPR